MLVHSPVIRAFSAPLPHASGLNPPSSAVRLGLAASAIAVLFGAFLVAPMPIWAGQPSGPPPSSASVEPVGWAGLILALFFVVAVCLPFRPYLLARRAVARAPVPFRLLVVLTVMLALIALLIYPALGSDIFDYVGFERMWVVYGDNPLTALPANRPGDWASSLVWYPDRTPAYGPVWAMVTWPLVRLAGDSAAAEVVGYKLLSLLADGACCWCVWSILAPALRQLALVSFSLLPPLLL